MNNPIYGSGQYSHEVPAVEGLVVEMRDGNHSGTAVWRRPDGRFAFASFDSYEVSVCQRVVLVRGQSVESVDFGGACAMDLEPPGGLMLVGLDVEHDVSAWLSEGAEILWDSARDLGVGGAS